MLRFYDSEASFGRRNVVLPGSFWKKEDLLAQMDRCGIERALVRHAVAAELDPMVGNQMLMEEIADTPNLTPLWTVQPHHTGEFWEPKELLSKMEANDVRAVTMFGYAGDQNFITSEWNCGALYDALEDVRIPLFIGLVQITGGYEGLQKILKAHPKLPIVLSGVTYRDARNLYALLDRYSNLHITSAGWKAMDGIEDVCAKFGAERILFGSSLPYGAGGAAIATVTYANISDEEKQLIASENLERLLGGVKL